MAQHETMKPHRNYKQLVTKSVIHSRSPPFDAKSVRYLPSSRSTLSLLSLSGLRFHRQRGRNCGRSAMQQPTEQWNLAWPPVPGRLPRACVRLGQTRTRLGSAAALHASGHRRQRWRTATSTNWSSHSRALPDVHRRSRAVTDWPEMRTVPIISCMYRPVRFYCQTNLLTDFYSTRS